MPSHLHSTPLSLSRKKKAPQGGSEAVHVLGPQAYLGFGGRLLGTFAIPLWVESSIADCEGQRIARRGLNQSDVGRNSVSTQKGDEIEREKRSL